MMIPVVAAAVLALTHQFGIEARRSQSLRVETQLRQLLHVGAAEAVRMGGDLKPTAEPIAIALPAELTSRGGKLTLTVEAAAAFLTVHVDAAFDSQRLRQTLLVSLDAKLLNAAIVPSP